MMTRTARSTRATYTTFMRLLPLVIALLAISLAAQDPARMGPPGAFAGCVRIAFTVRVLMMDAMGGHPEDRPAFERERAAPGQDVLDGFAGLVAPVREQSVITHADAQHPGDTVQEGCRGHRSRIDEEQCGDRADVKG